MLTFYHSQWLLGLQHYCDIPSQIIFLPVHTLPCNTAGFPWILYYLHRVSGYCPLFLIFTSQPALQSISFFLCTTSLTTKHG